MERGMTVIPTLPGKHRAALAHGWATEEPRERLYKPQTLLLKRLGMHISPVQGGVRTTRNNLQKEGMTGIVLKDTP